MTGLSTLAITVNGCRHDIAIDPRTTLLDLLREYLSLTGTKKGCNRGECGACTILVNGKSVNSCMALAASYDGRSITTIEGLARDGALTRLQQAFIDHDAFQCGFCTPGQIMSATTCLNAGRAGSDAEVREWMSGNICRCSAYPQIVEAIRSIARETADATV
jgi:xanthine dehydrogenase YagT iron-sulfur-binding subunit